MATLFAPQTIDFLWGLRFNNNKPWFLAHKAEYETHLLTPMRLLSAELQQWLAEAGFTRIRSYGDRVLRAPKEAEQRIYFSAKKE